MHSGVTPKCVIHHYRVKHHIGLAITSTSSVATSFGSADLSQRFRGRFMRCLGILCKVPADASQITLSCVNLQITYTARTYMEKSKVLVRCTVHTTLNLEASHGMRSHDIGIPSLGLMTAVNKIADALVSGEVALSAKAMPTDTLKFCV